MMIKTDIKKELKHLYNPSAKEITIADVPPMNFVMIDGTGDPNSSLEYQEAIEALYSISYSLKFTVRKEREIDYGVMPLEGLWWTDDMSLFSTDNKDIWKWTAMIMQPEYVTGELFGDAVKQVEKKKDLASLSKARFQSFHEGRAAQIMFIGPFSEEGPAIEKIHKSIEEQGGTFDGLVQKHHEVYLNDFRRTAPEKLKTVIRQPFNPASGKSG
ncbi:GyrI-like domain-containing protein [Chloroflexota bacterium]